MAGYAPVWCLAITPLGAGIGPGVEGVLEALDAGIGPGGAQTAGPGVALDAGIGPGGAQTAASNGRTVMKTNGATGWQLAPLNSAKERRGLGAIWLGTEDHAVPCLETKASKSKVAPIIILVQPTFNFFPPSCPGCNLHTSGLAAGNEKH